MLSGSAALFAASFSLSLQYVGNQGQTEIYRAAISNSVVQSIQAITLRDARAGGGADGVFSGFDVDCAFLDRDGLFSTVGDRILPIFTNTTVEPGAVRNPQTTPYRPTAATPGFLQGLTASGTIDHARATLGVRDGVYGNPLTVDTTTGSLTLGDGGALHVSFPLTEVPTNGVIYLFVGVTGIGTGERLAGTVEVFDRDLNLTIAKAVELRFITQLGRSYQIQSSMDFTNWSNEAGSIPGTGNVITRCFPSDTPTKRFFRVQSN